MTVIRPFELPDGRLVVQLITLGPGLCGGDAIHIEVTAEDGARVVVTTTAATRVMTMEPGEHAEQHVVLRAGAGRVARVLPRRHDSLPRQRPRADRAGRRPPRRRASRVIETWAMGRAARGEYLQFRAVEPDDAARRRHGRLRRCHRGGAARPRCRQRAVLAGRRYVASGFWYGARAHRRAHCCGSAGRGHARVAGAVAPRPGLPAGPGAGWPGARSRHPAVTGSRGGGLGRGPGSPRAIPLLTLRTRAGCVPLRGGRAGSRSRRSASPTRGRRGIPP